MIALISFFLAFSFLLSAPTGSAEEQTFITSETLEYREETSTYIARGSVRVQKDGTIIEANEVSYQEKTSEIVAVGNVRYNEPTASITASRAELNLETKTGILYDAEIFFEEENYYISGKKIEKKGETFYSSPEATFTTCDDPEPAWCFRGKNLDADIKKRLKARNVVFYIKNIPLLYTPYLRAPIVTERQTGFLVPDIDYSKSKGGHLRLPFFWAISENRDTTVIADIYSKKGLGEGLEYRYVAPQGIKGSWWLYHIRDTELNKDFYELRALHEQRSTEGIGGFLNLNIVNEKEFYREFNPFLEIRTRRFLESTGEISLPLKNSRAYLLSQYWIDLGEEIRPAPQRLPEVGYVLNPIKVGHFWLSTSATASNFWRDEGILGQRIDIFPKILHTFGNDVVITQSLGLRETVYALHRTENTSLQREALEYSIMAHTRLLKKYGSFMHVVEPSIGYTLITDSEDPPLLDSTELFKKTSTIELSLLNRFFNGGGELFVFRASQGFEANNGDRPFLPFRLEAGIKRPFSLRFDATYDVHQATLDSVNSDLGVKVSETTFTAGQRYNRKDEIVLYTAGIEFSSYRPWYVKGRIWYDAEEKVVKDITLNVTYMSQCWAFNIEFVKRPGDFMVSIRFDLLGVTRSFKI